MALDFRYKKRPHFQTEYKASEFLLYGTNRHHASSTPVKIEKLDGISDWHVSLICVSSGVNATRSSRPESAVKAAVGRHREEEGGEEGDFRPEGQQQHPRASTSSMNGNTLVVRVYLPESYGGGFVTMATNEGATVGHLKKMAVQKMKRKRPNINQNISAEGFELENNDNQILEDNMDVSSHTIAEEGTVELYLAVASEVEKNIFMGLRGYLYQRLDTGEVPDVTSLICTL